MYVYMVYRNIWWSLSKVEERDFMLTQSPPKRSPERLPELPTKERKRLREEEEKKGYTGKVRKTEESDDSSDDSSDDAAWLLEDSEDSVHEEALLVGNVDKLQRFDDNEDDDSDNDGEKYDMMTLNYYPEEE